MSVLLNAISGSEIGLEGWLLIIILSGITIFRRELSANKEFRVAEAGECDDVSKDADQMAPKRSLSDTVWDAKLMQCTSLQALVASFLQSTAAAAASPASTTNPTASKSAVVAAAGVAIAAAEGDGVGLLVNAQDALLHTLSYLTPRDLLELGCASRALHAACDDSRAWRSAWLARFGRVWASPPLQRAVLRWHCHHWQPLSTALPRQGWKVFYSQFALCWREWAVAGCNHLDNCLLVLHGRVLDITTFVDEHPGSPETLLDNAGADTTSFFEDVGHSADARELMAAYVAVPDPAGESAAGCGNSSGSGSVRWGGSSGYGGSGGGSGRSFGSGARTTRSNSGSSLRLTAAAISASSGFVVMESVRRTLERQRASSALPVHESPKDSHDNFACSACGEDFVPRQAWEGGSSNGGGGGNGGGDVDSAASEAAASAACSHAVGKRRVVFVPLSERWVEWYSCCGLHAELQLTE